MWVPSGIRCRVGSRKSPQRRNRASGGEDPLPLAQARVRVVICDRIHFGQRSSGRRGVPESHEKTHEKTHEHLRNDEEEAQHRTSDGSDGALSSQQSSRQPRTEWSIEFWPCPRADQRALAGVLMHAAYNQGGEEGKLRSCRLTKAHAGHSPPPGSARRVWHSQLTMHQTFKRSAGRRCRAPRHEAASEPSETYTQGLAGTWKREVRETPKPVSREARLRECTNAKRRDAWNDKRTTGRQSSREGRGKKDGIREGDSPKLP